MKYAILALILIGVVLFLYNCKNTTYTIDTLPTDRVIFGQGGGFTGAYVDFILLENGQIFKQNSLTKEMKELTSIKKKHAKKLFEQVKSATITPVKEPGNMTYSLRYQTAETEQSVTWGNPSYQVDSTIQKLYDELATTINPLKKATE